MKRPAVFFDRDNTLIACDGYLGDPEKVVLIEGAAEIVARVRALGYAAVVFSNQSGVARGMYTKEDVHRVNARLDELLADQNPNAVIDRHEFCPFHPEGTVPEYARESELRKPRPGMIFQAAEKLALDLPRSWVIGDAPRDIEAGKAAGCKTIWFKDPNLPPSSAARELMLTVPDAVASSLREAMDVIAREALVRQQSAPEVVAESEGPQEPAGDVEQSAAREMPVEARRPAGARTTPAAKPLMQALAKKRATVAAETPSQPASPAGPLSVSTARLEELAAQILQELQRRREVHDSEFSVSKLMAGIIQILAIAVLLAGYMLYRRDLTPVFLAAIFLQAFTIALLIMGRQR